mgnify:CR=1 FL=1
MVILGVSPLVLISAFITLKNYMFEISVSISETKTKKGKAKNDFPW